MDTKVKTHHILYGKFSYVDTLTDETVNALLLIGAIRLVREYTHEAGVTRVYTSVSGSLPRGVR